MNIIQELLQGIPLPKMVKLRQSFPASRVADVAVALRRELRQPGILDQIKPAMTVAIAVGSRGVADLSLLVRVTVEELIKRGARPFIVPAMGSHGGATPAGQIDVLAHLGVTGQVVHAQRDHA